MEDPVKDPMAHVWVILVTGEDEDIHMVEAHVSKESADAAAKVLTMDEYYDLEIKMLELKSIVEIESSPKASSNSKKVKQAKKADTESEEDEGSASNEEGTTKEKRASRQKLPDVTDAIPNVLNGLTIIFTGIMEKNRKTNQAVVLMLGGTLTSNVKSADYVVLGTKPGAKKVEDIQKHNADTITEKEFYTMLKTGVPKEKRERIAAEEEPPKKKKKQKK